MSGRSAQNCGQRVSNQRWDPSFALRTTTQILSDDANGFGDYVTDCFTPLNEDLITPDVLFLTRTASAPSQVAAADILPSARRLKNSVRK